MIFDNSTYASGIALAGIEGKQGKSGENANSIFYIPVDLRTSNNIDFAINKIKNNISFDTDEEMIGKSYSAGDMFYSSNGRLYMLSEDMNSFFEIGEIEERTDPITRVVFTSDKKLSLTSSDWIGFSYYAYFMNDASMYYVGKLVKDSTLLFPSSSTSANVLIEYVSNLTHNSKFYKIVE